MSTLLTVFIIYEDWCECKEMTLNDIKEFAIGERYTITHFMVKPISELGTQPFACVVDHRNRHVMLYHRLCVRGET